MVEQQIVALTKTERWRDQVQLQIYYLDQDPAAGRQYAPITSATAVINRKQKLNNVTKTALAQALEQVNAELRGPS